jgi:hypothetical protein
MNDIEGLAIEEIIQRYPTESAVEYAGFLEYARLPKHRREDKSGLLEIAEKLGQPSASIVRHKNLYNWDDRVALLDAYEFKREFEQRQSILSKDNERYIEQTRKVKNGLQMQLEKALSVLEGLLDYALMAGREIKTGEILTQDGVLMPTHTRIEMKAKVSDISPLLRAIAHTSRLINDLPTEIVENKIIETSDLSSLTTQEIEELLSKTRAERLSISGIQKLEGTQ